MSPIKYSQAETALAGSGTLLTMYDLPSEDPEEPGLADEYHGRQEELLSATFAPENYPMERIFCNGDINLYYDSQHPLWYKRPDWFAAVGVPELYRGQDMRMSYVVWDEEVKPIVVVELLSESTKDEDLGKERESKRQERRGNGRERGGEQEEKPPSKWEVYEGILKIPYYFVHDGKKDILRAFVLRGDAYEEEQLGEPKLWISELGLGLGIWDGSYQRRKRKWLRWYDRNQNWILTPEERERQEKERERQEKEVALQQAERERQEKEVALQQVERERQEKEEALARYQALLARLEGLDIQP